jgi:hypothetical protein
LRWNIGSFDPNFNTDRRIPTSLDGRLHPYLGY